MCFDLHIGIISMNGFQPRLWKNPNPDSKNMNLYVMSKNSNDSHNIPHYGRPTVTAT